MIAQRLGRFLRVSQQAGRAQEGFHGQSLGGGGIEAGGDGGCTKRTSEFENETRTIARLRHPNIVGIHDVGRSGDGLPWFTMPYLARGHLGQRDYAGNEDAVRHILRSLLDALEYAHGRGVVHRDVKPENVMFDDGDRPLLTDFGIAQRRGYGSRVTHAGFAVGSTGR